VSIWGLDRAVKRRKSDAAARARGYYTLSLAPRFLEELLRVEGVTFMINYGLDTLPFPAAMPVGDRIRMHLRLDASKTYRAASC
jgi:acyl dehydratase